VGSDTFAIGASALVGLAVSSHDVTQLATGTFDTVTVTRGGASPVLPAGWAGSDVGAVGRSGSSGAAGGVFTVRGAGADVWGTADAFHLAARPLTGDGRIQARVAGISGTQPWTKAGVMIRDSTAAGAPHAFMLVSAGKGPAFQRRTAAGGLSTSTAAAAAVAPLWVRLERAGDLFTASVSADGAAWTVVARDTIRMGSTVLAGLAVSSHADSEVATATFDHVTVGP
jgi:hypothetical protein